MLKISIISLSNKLPHWITVGIDEFSKRLKEFAQFSLVELPLIKRNKDSDLKRIREKEADIMIEALPKSAYIIALAINGECFSSEALAIKLSKISVHHSHLCFLIGGPEGLHEKTLTYAQAQWSLSSLTLPHALARLLLLEALYRAFTIISNHPYHK